MLTQLDREKVVADLYRAGADPRIVEVPELTFLMIDGRGDPATSTDYQRAINTLFTLSYGIRFAIKRAGGAPAKVSPLEGLWWAADPGAFERGDRSTWNWTAMVRQPDDVTTELVDQAARDAVSRGRPEPIDMRLEQWTEGRAAQVLHVGPYAAEAPTIRRLHQFIADQGGRFDAIEHKHHEIYIGDPRRAAPDRLRTIIRQSFA